ncbi:MAG: hypothetical protein KAH06_04105 [Desulfobacterales bacterium]|nr:hypothetical protein [Desulfobacterales bacterium]
MADIISLYKKQKLTSEKKAALLKKQKLLSVQQVMHCTHCASKCEKCRLPIDKKCHDEKHMILNQVVPYRFCKNCLTDYKDFIDTLKGEGDQDCYWHNDAWLTTWQKWIDYRGAVDSYKKSKEFRQLMQEFKQSDPD